MPQSQNSNTPNRAVEAAQEAESKVYKRIDSGQGFIMEAGAGAGKTTSLKNSLRYILDSRSLELERNNQRVACITYTEAATEQLSNDIDNNPNVFISTIHAFCWSLIKNFQSTLTERLREIPKWEEKLSELEESTEGNITIDRIVYDQGYRTFRSNVIHLHHDDVPQFMAMLLESEKFCHILASRFPILFIDEYQDTNKTLMDSIITNVLDRDVPLLIGLFGDHWQRIYDNVCGEVRHEKLPVIKKHANFRSSSAVVDVLNKMRPGLEQFTQGGGQDEDGEIKVFHTNSWNGQRGTGAHRVGSLPDDVARQYFSNVKNNLMEIGWDLSPSKTKILLLTNSMLAKEQGYENLLDCFQFPFTDQLMQKEDEIIKFFLETVEPASEAYANKKYGEMFKVLNARRAKIINHQDKLKWAEDMGGLMVNRKNGTIGDVIDYLYRVKKPRLTDRIIKKHEELLAIDTVEEVDEEMRARVDRLTKLRAVPYAEIRAFSSYIDGQTPFSTKHKVKGAEFENVLVVFSQGWSKYNFDKMLSMNEWADDGRMAPPNDFFENNRNLFYVVCSRPRKRLALLFTHTLSSTSMSRLQSWFGADVISEASLNNDLPL